MLAGAVGNVLEWYDFAAYGYFASALAKNFFPSGNTALSLASTFGVFAAAFFMRPVGGALFGHIGDRFGRKRALLTSAGLMTAATFAGWKPQSVRFEPAQTPRALRCWKSMTSRSPICRATRAG